MTKRENPQQITLDHPKAQALVQLAADYLVAEDKYELADDVENTVRCHAKAEGINEALAILVDADPADTWILILSA